MTTFNLIINKIINFENNVFSFNYKNDNLDNMYKIFFKLLHENKDNKYNSKFDFLNETLNNFYFHNKKEEREEFINIFFKIQRTYHVLNNFCYLYKYKKSKIVVNTDLQLNEIKLTEPNVICIYHINNRYLFKVQEILKLIYTSLTNSYMHFAEPICIKNPYNNISFGKSILYYIDYILGKNVNVKAIKPNHLDIFLKFRESNFDMTTFVNKYEYILREYSIQNYINNSTNEILKNDILNIIKQFNKKIKNEDKKIFIAEEFPVVELIKIFKPYLYLHLIEKYSLVSKNKSESNKKLFKKLIEFQSFNPQFGRKIIKLKGFIKKGKFKKIISHIEFNTIHKKFELDNLKDFMTNHLSYKYDDYSVENENNSESTITLITQFIYYPFNNLNENENENDNDNEDTDEENEENEENEELNEEEYDEEYDDEESIS